MTTTINTKENSVWAKKMARALSRGRKGRLMRGTMSRVNSMALEGGFFHV